MNDALLTKSTIEFNTDKQAQRKREINTIIYQNQPAGVNHSLNHNQVLSKNPSGVEEAQTPIPQSEKENMPIYGSQ